MPGKDVSGHVILHKVTYYQGCQVYIRQYGDLFQYDVIFDNQLYSYYFLPEREKGKDITKGQVLDAIGFTFASACTTIDALIEKRKTELLTKPVKSKEIN